MIYRRLGDIIDTDRHVCTSTFESRRFLLKNDLMGFTLNDTLIYEKTETLIHYQHHLEAVYCISGEGKIILDDGTEYAIHPGVLYALNNHDRHRLIAFTQMRLISIFNPPLVGPEVHDGAGVYPLIGCNSV